jgi:hypothetical protein
MMVATLVVDRIASATILWIAATLATTCAVAALAPAAHASAVPCSWLEELSASHTPCLLHWYCLAQSLASYLGLAEVVDPVSQRLP